MNMDHSSSGLKNCAMEYDGYLRWIQRSRHIHMIRGLSLSVSAEALDTSSQELPSQYDLTGHWMTCFASSLDLLETIHS